MILKNTNFEKMDKLSLARKPFFFFVDFEGENVEIFDENELEEKGILVEFQDFKTHHKGEILDKEIFWEFFPESMDVYQQGFEIVQKNIHLGNSYLVNYTSKTLINTNRSLEEIFYLSKAKYKVFYPNKFVFFSPETFIKINNQKIFTYPMKGTIDAEIPNAENILRESKKEKAEHYTVVDLLRNDLSMVADNVQVAQFQKIDYLKTKQKNLLAMSSEIMGEVKQEFQNRIGSIMKKILPAGSILGAPKLKTLEIILEAERYKRGYYTGVCGYFDGENLDTCVMIRMIEKKGEKYYFRSGGGVTHQSNLDDEYEELKNKIYVPIY